MSDLKDLLSRLKVDNVESKHHYIYYDDSTKKIHKISPREEQDSKYPSFEISSEKVEPILAGQVRTEDFYVYFDYGSKSYSIQRKSEEKFSNISLTEVLPCVKGDLSLFVDRRFVKFEVNENLKEHLKSDKTQLHFIITERSNPYVMYSTFSVDAEALNESKIEHQLLDEQIRNGLSIYTNPVFSTYSFEVAYD